MLAQIEALAAAQSLAILGGFAAQKDPDLPPGTRALVLLGPREPGFWVTQTAAHVSIAAAYLSDVDAEALKKQIESHIAQDPASELTEAVIVRGPSDLRGLAMPPYARVLLAALFTQAN